MRNGQVAPSTGLSLTLSIAAKCEILAQ